MPGITRPSLHNPKILQHIEEEEGVIHKKAREIYSKYLDGGKHAHTFFIHIHSFPKTILTYVIIKMYVVAGFATDRQKHKISVVLRNDKQEEFGK